MSKLITINEELLWNTLHPFGMARFLSMVSSSLSKQEGKAHRFEVGAMCGRLEAIAEQLENLEINDNDWAEFRRMHQPFGYEPGAYGQSK